MKGQKRELKPGLVFIFIYIVYIAVNALLIIGNLFASPEYSWFKCPILGGDSGLV
jgi:hypothetical protein